MAVYWNEDDGDDGVVIALARFSDLREVEDGDFYARGMAFSGAHPHTENQRGMFQMMTKKRINEEFA